MAGIEVEIRVDNDEMLMDEGKESSEEEEGEIVDNEDDDDPFWVAPKQPDTRDTHCQVIHESITWLCAIMRMVILQSITHRVFYKTLVILVVPRLYKNNEFSVFSIDREFLEINDETKLQERARRFNLEAETKKRPAITLKQLEKLYNSMGITPNDSNTRLNTLHMRGTQNMDTQQVFDYFKQYGPAAIEWVNDFCCNVVWVDEISAARALLSLSVPIRGATNPRSLTPRYELDEDIRATLVHSLGDDMEVDEGGKSIPVETEDDESAVDISRVRIPVPPGTWRCGVPASSGGEDQDILLRFATKSDRKLPRAERSSEYYRTFGNPNYGGMPGLISASRKRKLRQFSEATLLLPPTLARQAALFEDVGDECLLKRDARLKLPSAGGNPWVNLAKTWSNFERNKNKIAPLSPLRTIPPPPSPRSSEDSDLESARNRLGAPGDSGEDSDSWRGGRGRKIARRMHADVEEKKLAKRRESNLRTRLNQLIGAHMRERVGPQRPSPSPPSSSPTPEDELGGALPEDIAITFRNPGPGGDPDEGGGPGGPEEDGSPLYEDEEEEGEGELEEEEGGGGVGGEIEEDGEIDEASEQERDGDSSDDSEAGARRGRPRQPVFIKTEPDIPIGRDGRMMLGKSGPPPTTRIKLERPDQPARRFRAIKTEKTTTSGGGSSSVERSKAVAGGGASENGESGQSETRSENRDESRSRAAVKPSEKQRPEKLSSEKRPDRRRAVKDKLSEKGSSDKRAAAASKNADEEIDDLVADVERLVDPGMNDEEEISAAVTVLKKDRKQKKGRERRRRRRRERSSSSESSSSDSSRSSSGSSSSSDSSSSSSSSSDSSSSSSSNSSSSSSSSSSSNSSTGHQKRSKKGIANSKRNGGDKSSTKSGASSKKTSSSTKKSSSRQESFKTGSRKTIKQEIPAKSVLKGADKNSAPFKPRNFGANADITRVEVRRSLSPPTGDENTRSLPRRNEVLSGRRDVLSDNRRRPREEETADSRRRPDAHDDERMEEDDFASSSGFGRDRDENNRKRRSPPKTSSGKFGKSRYSSESPSARHYSRSEKYFANRAPTDRESPRRNRNYTSRNEDGRSGRFVDGSRNGDRLSSRRGDGIRRRIDSFDRSGRGRNRRQEPSSHEDNADDDTIFDKREVSGAKIVDLREKLKKKNAKASSSVPDKERLNIAVQIDNDNYRARRRGEASSEEESNEESDL